MERNTVSLLLETIDELCEPALVYASAPADRRQVKDLVTSLHLPVDLASAGFVVRLTGLPDDGYRLTVTRPAGEGIPTLSATGEGPTWCDAVTAMHGQMARLLERISADAERESALAVPV